MADKAPYPTAGPQPGAPPGHHVSQVPPGIQVTQAPPGIHVSQVPAVVATGNCPSCRIGNIIEDYSTCGIILAICFFPLGIICCLMMKDKKCSHCGTTF